MTDIITIITSVATLLAAVAAFWTILEVKRQRVATYRPRLAILSRRIVVRSIDSKLQQHDQADVPFRDSYSLNLVNLGFGSALDLVVTWHVDYDDFVRSIKDMPSIGDFQISDGQLIEIKSNTDMFPIAFASTKHDLEMRFDHIQPLSAQGQAHTITMPTLLVNLLRVYLFLAWRSLYKAIPRRGTKQIANLSNIPVFIQLVYRDLSGRKYRIRDRLLADIRFVIAGIERGEQWSNYLTCDLSVHHD